MEQHQLQQILNNIESNSHYKKIRTINFFSFIRVQYLALSIFTTLIMFLMSYFMLTSDVKFISELQSILNTNDKASIEEALSYKEDFKIIFIATVFLYSSVLIALWFEYRKKKVKVREFEESYSCIVETLEKGIKEPEMIKESDLNVIEGAINMLESRCSYVNIEVDSEGSSMKRVSIGSSIALTVSLAISSFIIAYCSEPSEAMFTEVHKSGVVNSLHYNFRYIVFEEVDGKIEKVSIPKQIKEEIVMDLEPNEQPRYELLYRKHPFMAGEILNESKRSVDYFFKVHVPKDYKIEGSRQL